MKFTIVALCIIGYTFAAQGSPSASSYCNANIDNLTTCAACYNDGVNTSIGARELLSGACAVKVTNAVTGCKYYNPLITATKSIGDCLECNALSWYNVANNAAAASIVLGCSATGIDTNTCSTANIVANCAQSYCYQAAGANTKSTGCRKCNLNFKGNTGLVNDLGYTGCVAQTITSCSYGHPTNNAACFECAAGFAVAAGVGTTCTAFTTDANCRQLSAGGSWCGACKNGYYFDATTCTLAANLMAVSGLIMALFFFN